MSLPSTRLTYGALLGPVKSIRFVFCDIAAAETESAHHVVDFVSRICVAQHVVVEAQRSLAVPVVQQKTFELVRQIFLPSNEFFQNWDRTGPELQMSRESHRGVQRDAANSTCRYQAGRRDTTSRTCKMITIFRDTNLTGLFRTRQPPSNLISVYADQPNISVCRLE